MDDKKLKKRFCKDFDVRIQVFDEPIFSDRLKLFSASEKYAEFCNFINQLGDPSKYFDICESVQRKAIEFIQNSEAYRNLMQGDSTGYSLGSNVSSLRSSEVYRVENCGKVLISIDLVKANFSSLVYHSKMSGKNFFDSYDYGKFLGQFTEYEMLKESKYIRQVIFGNCSTKRQSIIQRFMVAEVYSTLLNYNLIEKEDVLTLLTDELVLDISDSARRANVIEFLKGFNAFPIRVSEFVLEKLENVKGFKKLFSDGEVDFKCVQIYDLPKVIRKYNNLPENENDNYFSFEGRLAKFI